MKIQLFEEKTGNPQRDNENRRLNKEISAMFNVEHLEKRSRAQKKTAQKQITHQMNLYAYASIMQELAYIEQELQA